jgi:hypothetical protein
MITKETGTIIRIFPTGSVERGDAWESADIKLDSGEFVSGVLTNKTWTAKKDDKVVITSYLSDDEVTFELV